MDVFISYSSADAVAVRELTEDIELGGHQVWFDQDVNGGEDWWSRILERIRMCSVVVFALSGDALRSQACRSELDYARALGVPVIPVQIGPVDSLSATPVSHYQVVDYQQRDSTGGVRLMSSIVESAASASAPPPASPETDRSRIRARARLRLLAVVLSVVLLVAVVVLSGVAVWGGRGSGPMLSYAVPPAVAAPPIPVGTSLRGGAVSPDGRHVYVVNSGSGSLSVIDTASNTVIGPPIAVGKAPTVSRSARTAAAPTLPMQTPTRVRSRSSTP